MTYHITKLLYLDAPDTFQCDVEILECTKHENGYAVVLNQTPFYPEGGGQPYDTGWIGNVAVTGVIEDDRHRILHFVESELISGHSFARINLERRHDLMQQHAAQHLLSACLMDLFQAETVGFHLSDAYTSIDLNCKLDRAQLDQALLRVNHYVTSALPIQVLYPTTEMLKELPLRKMPTVETGVRIVQIGTVDYSPCGGTHPNNTAEIGLIMITRSENYKNGTRIEFLAGDRALNDYQQKILQSIALSKVLAIPGKEIISGVNKLLDTMKQLEKDLKDSKDIALAWETDALISSLEKSSPKFLIKCFSDRDFNALRKLAATTVKNVQGSALILCNKTCDQAQLICTRSEDLTKVDMRTVFNAANEFLEGKGGGNAITAQGGSSHLEHLDEALKSAERTLLAQMSA